MTKMKIYMMQSIKHRCFDELKRDTVRQNTLKNLYDTDISLLSEDNVSQRIIENDFYKIIRNAGLKMKKFTMDIYTSSRLGDLSHKEIAALYNISTNRVAKEITKASKIMDTIIKDYLHVTVVFILTSIAAAACCPAARYFRELFFP